MPSRLISRKAAQDCSPRRKPGVSSEEDRSRGAATESASFRAVIRIVALVFTLLSAAFAQSPSKCPCGAHPPGPPAPRSLKPYTGAPQDLRPFTKFTAPYYEYYQDLIEYNGAARDVPDPDLNALSEIRIGLLAPLYDHPDQVLGRHMLNGATMAIDEANANGAYGGKPFRLITHNDYDNWQISTAQTGAAKDSAIWGSASNDVVRMVYDDKVWAMFGSISSESTHIALRVTLKAETPIVNSASTDPTIPETIIPWYFTDIQDDRVQGYTLARHIYTDLGLKRVAILRVNDRYGRFGVIKFKDASRRLGHPVVIEQKFMRGDTDYRHQLQVIQDSRVDAIVLWTDIAPTAAILSQMQELGMKQRVFGSHRTIGEELIQLAGAAAENFEAVFPYDPARNDPRWREFQSRYEGRFHEKPDHFAALAYDAMQVLLDAICRAGLNRGRIRDALTGVTNWKGVTGDMVFDPNCKNIAPMYLASVHNGAITYRRITMEKQADRGGKDVSPVQGEHKQNTAPYARVGEDGVHYAGPPLSDQPTAAFRVAVFGPNAEERIHAPEVERELKGVSLVAINAQLSWGKASNQLVKAVYENHALAIIALDRNSAHLAEQIGVKAFVPVIAIAKDRALTSTNIPWIFRLPEDTSLDQALKVVTSAIRQAGPNREKIRDVLASGHEVAGAAFNSTGELR